MNKKILLVVILIVIGAVVWIFLKPGGINFGNNGKTGTADYKELTTNEKLEILESLKNQDSGVVELSVDEKLEILEGLKTQNTDTGGTAVDGTSGGSSGSTMTTEEKLKILESLKAQ